MQGIIDISAVLLEMGYGVTVTAVQRATCLAALQRAEAAVRRHLRYDPCAKERTEYYPLMDQSARTSVGVWEVDNNNAHFRRIAPGAGDVLFVRHIPIRSSVTPIVYVDYDGRSGSKSGAFASGTQKTHGSDWWPNYDGVDSSGFKYCSDGMLRSLGLWPVEPGAVKVVYTGGYTAAELAGTDDNLDASPIAQAVLNEAVRRARRAISRTGGRAGIVAGPLTSENLGDYSYSSGGTDSGMAYGSLAVSGESIELLQDFINLGFELAG